MDSTSDRLTDLFYMCSSGKTRWTEKQKRKEMERGLMNSKFTFKTLPDGSVDRTEVICTYCRQEMSYHWSTLSLKYHFASQHKLIPT